MKRKTVSIFLASLLAVLSVLSFNVFMFSVRLLRFSLIPPPAGERQMDLLAKNLLANRRLAQRVRDKHLNSDMFLVSFMAELIRTDKVSLLEEKYGSFFDSVIEQFPENIFLARSGLYPENDPSKDWENFDPLALRLMREPRLNSLVFSLLTARITEGDIPESCLPLLIFYLNWTQNFPLAENLLGWSSEKNRVENKTLASLRDDLELRKRRRPKEKYGPVDESPGIFFSVPFKNQNVEVEAGKNLILGENPAARRPDRRWIFIDISDNAKYSKGSFFGRIDSLERNRLRVMGFFAETVPGMGHPNAGLQLRKEIPAGEGIYLFHFRYKTSGESEIPSFRLSWRERVIHRLEPSCSEWKEVFYIFDNSLLGLDFFQPFLRMFGTGSAWFDGIGLYRIEWPGESFESEALIVR